MLVCLATKRPVSCIEFIVATNVFMLGMWLFFFVVTRTHMFVQAHQELHTQREEETWLLEQCKSDEFYHNMKKHSALCDSVEKNRRDVLLLNAMRQVIENSYLCGYESCTDIMARFVAKLMQQGIVTLCLALGALVLTPMLILPLWRRQMNRLADQHHRTLYHAPYGQPHYRLTDHPLHTFN